MQAALRLLELTVQETSRALSYPASGHVTMLQWAPPGSCSHPKSRNWRCRDFAVLHRINLFTAQLETTVQCADTTQHSFTVGHQNNERTRYVPFITPQSPFSITGKDHSVQRLDFRTDERCLNLGRSGVYSSPQRRDRPWRQSTVLYIEWLPDALSLGTKRPESEANH